MSYGVVSGFVEKGGERVTTGNSLSITNIQRSYPNTPVTVYISGTLTLATIYEDELGAVPKANPFTSDSRGYFHFWTEEAEVDLSFGGLAQFTYGNVRRYRDTTALPVYANNAAALAGGLSVGDFYRTGADPDPVCIVH